MSIEFGKLTEFLKAANRNTYADKHAKKAQSSRLHSEDYHFELGSLAFHDTYFGSRDFIGAEVVYSDMVPIWGMNYYGYLVVPSANESEVYDFLRDALLQDYSNVIPVRGPEVYERNGWRYVNSPIGCLDRFVGTEEIYHGVELLYRANYHGGFIG